MYLHTSEYIQYICIIYIYIYTYMDSKHDLTVQHHPTMNIHMSLSHTDLFLWERGSPESVSHCFIDTLGGSTKPWISGQTQESAMIFLVKIRTCLLENSQLQSFSARKFPSHRCLILFAPFGLTYSIVSQSYTSSHLSNIFPNPITILLPFDSYLMIPVYHPYRTI